MTANHVIPAGECSLSLFQSTLLPLVYASQVSVGDCIMTVSGQERVLMVEEVRGEGVYTIVTNKVNDDSSFPVLSFSCSLSYSSSSPRTIPKEYLVVNGIIASPFATNHMMANLYYNIHRFLYAMQPVLLSYQWLSSANEVSQRTPYIRVLCTT